MQRRNHAAYMSRLTHKKVTMIGCRFFPKIKRLTTVAFSSGPEKLPSKVISEDLNLYHKKNIQKYEKKADQCTPQFLERMKKRYSLKAQEPIDFSSLAEQYPKVPAIVEYTSKELKIPPKQIMSALQESPELADIAPAKWATCFGHLTQYGFAKQGILKMVTDYPGLLLFEEKELEDSMYNWMRIQFGESRLLPLLVNNPIFLALGEKDIDDRIPRLREYLEGRRSRLVKLLMNSPQVMFKKWEDVQIVMDYLVEPMRIPKSQIARSGVFRYNLFHLRCRFLFLYKTGVYIITKYNADPLETPKHPQLTDIVDTHEQKFVYRIAGLSLIEYEVFKEMMYAHEIYDDRDFFKPKDTYGLVNPYLSVNDQIPVPARMQKKRPKPEPPIVDTF